MYKPYNKESAYGRELLFLTQTDGVGDTYSPARIICSDRKCSDNANLVVLAETKPGFECFLALNEDGTDCYGRQCLFMAPVKMQERVRVFRRISTNLYHSTTYSMIGTPAELDKHPVGDDVVLVGEILIREWEE